MPISPFADVSDIESAFGAESSLAVVSDFTGVTRSTTMVDFTGGGPAADVL